MPSLVFWRRSVDNEPEWVKTLDPIEAGSVIVLRMGPNNAITGKLLLETLKQHYGHDDFLVVVLGLHENIDVIPPHEVQVWLQSRRGYFGGAGGHYLEES